MEGWFRVGARRAKVGRVKVGRLKGGGHVEMGGQHGKVGRTNRRIKRRANNYRKQKPEVVISSHELLCVCDRNNVKHRSASEHRFCVAICFIKSKTTRNASRVRRLPHPTWRDVHVHTTPSPPHTSLE